MHASPTRPEAVARVVLSVTDRKQRRRRASLAALPRAGAVVAAVLFSASAAGAQAVSAPTILQPGDAVRITVFRQPELSGEFWIAADSSIRHPLYQAVKVAGVPLSVVEARLAAFLRSYQETP